MTTPADTTPAASQATKRVTLRCPFCLTWNRVDPGRVAQHPKCGKCSRPLLLDRPVLVGDEEFQRTVSESDIPVMVDFYADWCGPCKMMAPAFDELAARWQGRALLLKLNTDLAQRTAQSFNIRGIPTTIVFVGGKEVGRQTGAVPARMLEAMLEKAAN
ncbi:MAG TPA: thioredoxin [Gemmatimonadaceae bacterium]|nr:thioredoxin [Gemmatimonadaceae bacterium]